MLWVVYMKKVFFALIFSCYFINICVASDDLKRYRDECLSIINKPEIKVEYTLGRLKYDFEKDRAYINKERKRSDIYVKSEYDDELDVDGLTSVRNGFEVELDTKQIGVSKGYKCVYPEKVKVFLGYYTPKIYIANDLPKDSCRYNLALRHEKTHMQIYIEALLDFLPELKKYTYKAVDDIGVKIVKPGENPQNLAEEFYNDYIAYLNKIVNKWQKEVLIEQQKLDKPENYMIESRICSEIDGLEE